MNTFPPEPPSPNTAKILELRELITQHSAVPPPRPVTRIATGIEHFDSALDGGLWKGGIVELVSLRRTCGASSILRGVLYRLSLDGLWTALVDGTDAFDPHLAGVEMLSRLLWLRCQTASEAVQSTDLLLRDGNLPVVFLDLRGNEDAELRKIGATAWYRLQRVIELKSVALLVFTSSTLVPCADVRLRLESRFTLDALEEEPSLLLRNVKLAVLRKRPGRGGTGRPQGEAEAWVKEG